VVPTLTGTSQAARQQLYGLSVVAQREVRLGRAIRGFELERVIAALGRDGDRAPAHLDRLTMLAQDIPEARTEIGQHRPKAWAIT
jgi:hypothetical protein